MEAWNLSKYESPYLAIKGVRFEHSTGQVLVDADVNEYIIEHGDDVSAHDVVHRLEALRRAGSAAWRELFTSSATSSWRMLLETMDTLGLIRDAERNVQIGRAHV